jgi:type I restriction-modification system DNA methylase subunit
VTLFQKIRIIFFNKNVINSFLFTLIICLIIGLITGKTVSTQLQFLKERQTISGNLVSVDATSQFYPKNQTSSKKRLHRDRIYAYTYEYKVGKKQYKGISYGKENDDYDDLDVPVTVSYVVENPKLSTMDGFSYFSQGKFPPAYLLLLFGFPLIGIILVIFHIKKGFQSLQ